jgi:hypothetical protein
MTKTVITYDKMIPYLQSGEKFYSDDYYERLSNDEWTKLPKIDSNKLDIKI